MGKAWTYEETSEVARLRRLGLSYRAIGQQVGRTGEQVRHKMNCLMGHTRCRQSVRKTVGALNFKCPPELLEARERRYEEPRTITMEQFGDPEPTRSALGKFCP
jgi:hypothetical protein